MPATAQATTQTTATEPANELDQFLAATKRLDEVEKKPGCYDLNGHYTAEWLQAEDELLAASKRLFEVGEAHLCSPDGCSSIMLLCDVFVPDVERPADSSFYGDFEFVKTWLRLGVLSSEISDIREARANIQKQLERRAPKDCEHALKRLCAAYDQQIMKHQKVTRDRAMSSAR